LFFRPGGKITVRPTGLDAPLDAERRDLSLSFALMPMAGVYEKIENNNTSVRLLGKNGQWTFLLNKRGRLEIQFQMQRGRIQLEVPQALAEQRWHHISASVNASVEQKATFRVYLNGALVVFVRGESEDDLLLGGHEPLVIGNELSFAGDALVQLDSVRISDGILDPTEVRREAFVRMPATHFAAPNPLPSALGSIPIGLDPRSGHVPRELAPWIGGPLESSLPSLVQLGDRLFDSVLLSTNSRRNPSQDKACSSCHQKSKGLSDGLRVAEGRTGLLSRNSSSVLNRLWGTEQFWDGSARSLVEQATMPITNVEELDGNPKEVLAALQESNMRGLFERAFGLTPKESLQMRQVALALAAYQLTLVSNASFADSVQINGSDSKIQRGRELFFGKARCFGCHSGTTLSDESFHVTGVGGADLGRSRVTDRVRDRRAFKTPTLRGIEQSAPYFHDGRAGTLADVILFYDKGGGDVPSNAVKDVDLFPLHLTPQERVDLEAFLRGL
jgi:cytochrome c peroxidase